MKKNKNSQPTKRSVRSLQAGTSGRLKPQKKDLRFMTMALKDEADNTKKLYHPELSEE